MPSSPRIAVLLLSLTRCEALPTPTVPGRELQRASTGYTSSSSRGYSGGYSNYGTSGYNSNRSGRSCGTEECRRNSFIALAALFPIFVCMALVFAASANGAEAQMTANTTTVGSPERGCTQGPSGDALEHLAWLRTLRKDVTITKAFAGEPIGLSLRSERGRVFVAEASGKAAAAGLHVGAEVHTINGQHVMAHQQAINICILATEIKFSATIKGMAPIAEIYGKRPCFSPGKYTGSFGQQGINTRMNFTLFYKDEEPIAYSKKAARKRPLGAYKVQGQGSDEVGEYTLSGVWLGERLALTKQYKRGTGNRYHNIGVHLLVLWGGSACDCALPLPPFRRVPCFHPRTPPPATPSAGHSVEIRLSKKGNSTRPGVMVGDWYMSLPHTRQSGPMTFEFREAAVDEDAMVLPEAAVDEDPHGRSPLASDVRSKMMTMSEENRKKVLTGCAWDQLTWQERWDRIVDSEVGQRFNPSELLTELAAVDDTVEDALPCRGISSRPVTLVGRVLKSEKRLLDKMPSIKIVNPLVLASPALTTTTVVGEWSRPPDKPDSSSQGARDIASQLKELAALKASGALTDEEFAQAKAKVLNGEVADESV